MKIIKNFDSWCDNALQLLHKSKFCYIVSFNLNFKEGDKVYQILQETTAMDHKILIGLNTMICVPGCQHCNINNQVKFDNVKRLASMTENFKIAQALHMKAFVTSNGAIIGGMNMTGSGWIDRSFLTTNRQLVKELVLDITNVFHTSEPYIAPLTIDTSLIFTFGRYKGRLIEEIRREDPAYFTWLRNNTTHKL